jgi:hypothetical protein
MLDAGYAPNRLVEFLTAVSRDDTARSRAGPRRS